MNTDKLFINCQSFTRVRLQLKFAFITRSLTLHKRLRRVQKAFETLS